MSKFLKATGFALVLGAGLAYLSQTKKGKKVVESSLDTFNDFVENHETYLKNLTEKTSDFVKNWDSYCPIGKCCCQLTKTSCPCQKGDDDGMEEDLAESPEDIPVHVDDIVINYDEKE